MARLWCSWVCGEEDYRPVTFPPNESILGWWCSGYDNNGNPTLCALVEASDEDGAAAAVKQDWPEFDGEWRFVEERPDDYMPGGRFPLSDWMRDRVERKA